MSETFWKEHGIKGKEHSEFPHPGAKGVDHEGAENTKVIEHEGHPHAQHSEPMAGDGHGPQGPGGHVEEGVGSENVMSEGPGSSDPTSHPGFASVQKKIQGEGYSKEAAGAILAKASRGASEAAKHSNPRLRRVKG